MSEHIESKRAKTSEMVVDAQTSCEILASAIREDGPEVVEIVERDIRSAFGVPGDGEGDAPSEPWVVDLLAMIGGLNQLVVHRLDKLVVADQALFAAHARSTSANHSREMSSEELMVMIRGARDTFRSAYPAMNISLLGLEGRTAQEPMSAVNQAQRIVAHLRGADLSKETPVFEHQRPDPLRFAASLEAAVEEAQAAIVLVESAKRQTNRAQIEKNETFVAYRQAFLRLTRIFIDLCLLAGKTELAKRVRPSRRRPGTLASMDPSEDGEPSSEEPPVGEEPDIEDEPEEDEPEDDTSSNDEPDDSEPRQ